MANYSKAFNFRGGFQVDTDVLVVRGEKVGIGSTIPQQVLDVNGIIKARGLEVDSTEGVDFEEGSIGILTVRDELYVGVSTLDNHGTIIAIGTGIITATNNSVGLVTYYGDGRFLQGLPTSQWIDIDVGLGYTSIYAAGNVGVDTIDPRYAFQVGGVPFVIPAGVGTVPFRFNQEGVGIESGNVYVSDDIRVGGGISVSGTIGVGQSINVDGDVGISSNLTVVGFVSAYEFIGIGSLITVINADNIAIGSIGSMRYGDTIVTKEVYANRFIGTATFAEDLVPEAQIEIDTIRANEIDAVTRFISTEGKLQIGNSDPIQDINDIDVKKSGQVTITGVSTSASARVFVGRERPATGNRSYGGIRYGGDSDDSQSNVNDLDLVNYDSGNLNYYLHSGQGGTTTGEFRWIYGQTDRILASLNKEGKLSLFGNSVTGNVNLSVVGISTFEKIVAEEAHVVGLTTIGGDLTVYGTINIEGSLGIGTDIEFQGGTFDSDLIVGADPDANGTGVKLGVDGVVSASNGYNLIFGGSPVFGVDPSGSVSAVSFNASGNIESSQNIIGLVVNATSTLNGPTFTDDVTGATATDLTVSGSLNATSLTANSSNIGVANATSIDFLGGTFIDSTSIVVDNITINSSLNGSFTVGGTLNVSGITASGTIDCNTLQASQGDITNLDVDSLTVDTISGLSSSIVFTTPINVTSTSTFDSIAVDQLSASNLELATLGVGTLTAGAGTSTLSIAADVATTDNLSVSGDVSATNILATGDLGTETDTIRLSFSNMIIEYDASNSELTFSLPDINKAGTITLT